VHWQELQTSGPALSEALQAVVHHAPIQKTRSHELNGR
jgi:hypothetical protein